MTKSSDKKEHNPRPMREDFVSYLLVSHKDGTTKEIDIKKLLALLIRKESIPTKGNPIVSFSILDRKYTAAFKFREVEFNTALNNYHRNRRIGVTAFRQALCDEHLPAHLAPSGDLIFEWAWREGRSEGMHRVTDIFMELVEFLVEIEARKAEQETTNAVD